MKKRLDLKAMRAANPNVDAVELNRSLKLVRDLAKIGIKPRTYSLSTKRMMVAVNETTEEADLSTDQA